MNMLREKLERRGGRTLFGTHVHLSDHRICEMLGQVGFDYLWVDTEHVSTDYKELEIHLIAAKAAGTPVVVRAPCEAVPFAKRVLEMGPDGIIFPMINSAEQARSAIDACIYPPEGKRGFGPFRALRYGLQDAPDYLEGAAKAMCRFVQIETRQAVEAMEEIAQAPYLDGFIIGPMDLSGSCGALGRCLDGEVDRLIDLAIQKARAARIPIGLSVGSVSERELAHWMGKGFDLLSAGADAWGIIKHGRELLQAMRECEAGTR